MMIIALITIYYVAACRDTDCDAGSSAYFKQEWPESPTNFYLDVPLHMLNNTCMTVDSIDLYHLYPEFDPAVWVPYNIIHGSCCERSVLGNFVFARREWVYSMAPLCCKWAADERMWVFGAKKRSRVSSVIHSCCGGVSSRNVPVIVLSFLLLCTLIPLFILGVIYVSDRIRSNDVTSVA